MNNHPFDLTKMDFDTIRLKRRKRLLLRSLPFTIIGLVIGIKLVSLTTLTSWGIKAYSAKDYSSAASRVKTLLFMNRMERYKAPFNEGTALLQSGKYDEAQKQLEESLKYVPSEKECAVRTNLALSLEMQADAQAGKQKYDQAILIYDQAKAVLAQGSCTNKDDKKQSGSDKKDKPQSQEAKGDQTGDKPSSKDKQNAQGSKSDSQKAQDTSNRIDDKSAKAKLDRNGDKSDNPQSSSQQSQAAQEPSQDQQQKLKDMQDKAKSKQNQSIRDRVIYDNNDRDYKRKVW